MYRINIIGSGLAGLSAAITLAENSVACNLISLQNSERAQSVLAEGGINGALNTMGEDDNTENHFNDTVKGGVYLSDPNAVDGLTKNAPQIIRWLESLGVPFNTSGGEIILRNFGGQKKKRTAYARSSTGKIIMSAVIDEARKYEACGLIKRYCHHEFVKLLIENNVCVGALIRDRYSGKFAEFKGTVIFACGGMNGIFPGMTTGTTQNSGDAACTVFAQGVEFGNLEMLQYHPTTIGISGKRCLVTEAARGEGGRLYIERNGDKWYFMEEKYPELKNLMPRDVVAREMFFVRRQPECGNTVYLDMTGLSESTWKNKLSDLREEIIHYLSTDPKTDPIPVKEGIHYFMGGINTNECHQTNVQNLYAAGECTCQYHGANRLGGNSMLGALYGGRKAALTILNISKKDDKFIDKSPDFKVLHEPFAEEASPIVIQKISDALLLGLGIVRNQKNLDYSLKKLCDVEKNNNLNLREKNRIFLAKAMIISALGRKESRGAHYREDYPNRDESFQKTSAVRFNNGEIDLKYRDIPERRISANENQA